MARTTAPLAAFSGGNRLFEAAVAASGLGEAFARRTLGEAFGNLGSSECQATADELGVLLPEIERRLLLALPPETAAPAVARLRRLLLTWVE
jgi:hypothetical protein